MLQLTAIMKIFLRITSVFSALVFLFSCNFCFIEYAVAFTGHCHSVETRELGEHPHQTAKKEEHSNSDDHDSESTCCSSLIAVYSLAGSPTSFEPSRNFIGIVPFFEKLFSQIDTGFEQKFEFPPGASPPAVYLLTHFTHAPPVSL